MAERPNVKIVMKLRSNGIDKKLTAGLSCTHADKPVCFLAVQEGFFGFPIHAVAHLSPEDARNLGTWLLGWAARPVILPLPLDEAELRDLVKDKVLN